MSQSELVLCILFRQASRCDESLSDERRNRWQLATNKSGPVSVGADPRRPPADHVMVGAGPDQVEAHKQCDSQSLNK